MEAIPPDWIDKIFNCLAEWYGDRWTRLIKKPHEESYLKTIWLNGLHGLTYDEIKNALRLCRRHAENKTMPPPHVLEFYRYAKGTGEPYINYHPKANDPTGDPKVASRYIDEIKQKLGRGASQEIYARLGK
jgi:hypothetical protein